MKFLIRELGWEAWRAEVEARARARCAPRAARGCRSIPQTPPVEAAPRRAASRCRRRPRRWLTRVAAAARCAAPACVRRPACPARRRRRRRRAGRATNVRPQRQAGLLDRHRHPAARRPHGRAAARARATSRSPTATARCARRTSRTCCCAGCATRTCASSTRGWPRPASAAAGAGTLADVTSCPGAESCRLAVTQSRGLGRLLARAPRGAARARGRWRRRPRHQDQRLPERLRPAPRRRHRLPGQRAPGRRHGRAAVLRDARRRRRPGAGARFGRLAAKVPARRVPEAVERLLALYAEERQPGESARAFLQRVDLARVKALLADLEAIAAGDAPPRTSWTSAKSRGTRRATTCDRSSRSGYSSSPPIAAGSDGSEDHSLQEPA